MDSIFNQHVKWPTLSKEVIIAGKQLQPQWLGMDCAEKNCSAEIGVWKWASNDKDKDKDKAKDAIIACAENVPVKIKSITIMRIIRDPILKVP